MLQMPVLTAGPDRTSVTSDLGGMGEALGKNAMETHCLYSQLRSFSTINPSQIVAWLWLLSTVLKQLFVYAVHLNSYFWGRRFPGFLIWSQLNVVTTFHSIFNGGKI